MEFTAKYMQARIGPRKARVVVDQIRRQPLVSALNTLKYSNKRAAVMISKVLRSAWANAQDQDPQLDEESFVVSDARVDAGQVLHRIRYAAHGRIHRIRKRKCHITVTISDGQQD